MLYNYRDLRIRNPKLRSSYDNRIPSIRSLEAQIAI